jgi:hypothetical protein
MGYGLYALSPGTGSLAPVIRESVFFANLTSAPGGQDHTTSPSAANAIVAALPASTAPRCYAS